MITHFRWLKAPNLAASDASSIDSINFPIHKSSHTLLNKYLRSIAMDASCASARNMYDMPRRLERIIKVRWAKVNDQT